jgi:hypothetical protein
MLSGRKDKREGISGGGKCKRVVGVLDGDGF